LARKLSNCGTQYPTQSSDGQYKFITTLQLTN